MMSTPEGENEMLHIFRRYDIQSPIGLTISNHSL